jgi:hypothetical protein
MAEQQERAKRIEGHFVWTEGMLFFKADGGESIATFPFLIPAADTSDLNVASGRVYCQPAHKVIPFLPEDLKHYEVVISIVPATLAVPLTESFAQRVLRRPSPFPAMFSSPPREALKPSASFQEGTEIG